MSRWSSAFRCALTAVGALALAASSARAADIMVPAGGNLQTALNAAGPGDTILLAPGATYVGNFTLPVHGGTAFVTIRTAGNDSLLPGSNARITPAHSPYLAKLRSPDSQPALKTAPRAAYWRVMLVELLSTQNGAYDIVQLGDGSSAQNALSLVPQHLIMDRVYIHGDRLVGQKRGIALNSGNTTIINCHISDIKAVSQDSQAIAGANGPGPYHLENNHLEASGQMFQIGGDDPKIPGLVPADLIFRGNTLTRPVSLRNPIVPIPPGVSASAASGGSLAAGTYAYRVVARRPAGNATATSTASAEITATVGAGGRVTIGWNAVQDATEYRVYGRKPGGQSMYWTVTTTSFTDTGAAGAAGTPPSAGTIWQVKNLFELKNLRRAKIDHNLMENNWLEAQNGIAVLFTTRNQNGGCLQCVVEDVVFEYNTVRNIAGGINILGIDNRYPSQQANNIRIRHNEFSGLDRSWGGTGYFLNLTDNPRDIVVDHNTIISPNGLGVITVSGPAVYGFVFTNNVARHNSYGIFGNGYSYGNTAINHYFPNGVIRSNVLAGGKAAMYPAGNLFPTTSSFEAHFADYAGGSYTLQPSTDWAAAGTDGMDLGAATSSVTAQNVPPAQPLQVVTQSLPSAMIAQGWAATLQAAGGASPYQWSVTTGSLPVGIALDPLTGTLWGTPSAAGTFAFTVQVIDAAGVTATQPLTVTAGAAIAPVQIVTSAIAPAMVALPYKQHLDATGGLGAYVWSVGNGQLPSGITLSSAGDLSGTSAASGTWTFTAVVRDAQDPTRQASCSFKLAVATSQNKPPVVMLTASSNGVVPVGAPVTLTAGANDTDGTITRVDFFVNGQAAGSSTFAPFTFAWVARDGGPYAITAAATDDDGATTMSPAVNILTSAEIVIYASDVTRMVGGYQLVADPTAASGRRLWNPNRYHAKILSASASPTNYAEFTFYAEKGRPYRLWIRGYGERNTWTNDSAYLQFSGTVDAAGARISRIGTTASMWYSLEEYSHAGIMKWGWQDNGYGKNVVGQLLYFERTGPQTIRIQQREDGLSIDQIVISPSRYLSLAPGLPKNDLTIVNR